MKFGARYVISVWWPYNASWCDISLPTLYMSKSDDCGGFARVMTVNKWRNSETEIFRKTKEIRAA